MGPRMKSPAAATHTVVNVTLGEGDWLDVMDSEGTWNVAQIIRFIGMKNVEVRYDGWGNEFNETVELNSDRVAPYHTYTWSVKCWAKYKNWPWWPAIVTIRSPGTLAGQTYLQNEDRLFVDFLDRKDLTKRCRCWVEMSKITPFEEKYDDRRKRTTGTDFERALELSLKSTASNKFPTFVAGTLPVLYTSRIADPVKLMKKRLGMNAWAGSLSTSRERHRAVYSYKPVGATGVVEDDDDDDDDDYLVQFAAVSDKEDDTPKKTRGKGKTAARGKARRTAAGGNGQASRRAREVTGPVPQAQDVGHALDGPSAQSPAGEPEEQPLYLPPLEELSDAEQPSASKSPRRLSSEPTRGSREPGLPPVTTEGTRKRKSREDSDTLSADAEGEVGVQQVVGLREVGPGEKGYGV